MKDVWEILNNRKKSNYFNYGLNSMYIEFNIDLFKYYGLFWFQARNLLKRTKTSIVKNHLRHFNIQADVEMKGVIFFWA